MSSRRANSPTDNDTFKGEAERCSEQGEARAASGDTRAQQPNGSNGGGAARAATQSGSVDIFNHAPPEGHAKTVSAVVGEIVWLMSQSPIHKQFFIADLEWFVMTPILLKQFRVFYAKNKPVGVVLWAFVDDEVAKRLSEGTSKLRPQDWKSGDELWVVEAIAPFGGPEEMIKNLKEQVFADKQLRYLALSPEGKREVKVL